MEINTNEILHISPQTDLSSVFNAGGGISTLYLPMHNGRQYKRGCLYIQT